MKNLFASVRFLFFFLYFLSFPNTNGEDYFLKNILNKESQIIIESNNQKSDLDNSIFYAEGDVIITNTGKEFIAKANKAIIYKLIGKIKLIGDVEISTDNFNKVRAAEINYFLKEKKIEAISDLNQRVKTTLVFNENKISNSSKER